MEVKAAVAESLDPASAAFDADLLPSQADASFHEIRGEQDSVPVERCTGIREDSARAGMGHLDAGLTQNSQGGMVEGFNLLRGKNAELRHEFS